MPATIRFDVTAPYEVEEKDEPFAKPVGAELLARVYRPRGEITEPLAAVVEVHGGAWARGDRTTGALQGRALAASGLVVVSLDFRQAP
jgi:acetyl esterase/lipase